MGDTGGRRCGGRVLDGTAAAQGWNLNQQAADACQEELTLRMATEAAARDPHAEIDTPGLRFGQRGRNTLQIQGSGTFRRNRFDRVRRFTFDCTVDIRNGNTQATYRWSGSSWGGAEDAGDVPPPSFRPPPSGGWPGSGPAYPPSGRVFFSGGIVNRASGKGLDVQDRSTRDAANVQQWDFGGNPNQTWEVVDQGNGLFSIISQGSGKALDVANHDAADGANVVNPSGDKHVAARAGYRWRYQIVSPSGKVPDVVRSSREKGQRAAGRGASQPHRRLAGEEEQRVSTQTTAVGHCCWRWCSPPTTGAAGEVADERVIRREAGLPPLSGRYRQPGPRWSAVSLLA